MKHGLLAREILLAAPDGFAGRKEFMQLLDQLRADLGPVGVLENWQVERIVVSLYWQSVVLRAQMGKFWKQNCYAEIVSETEVDHIDRDALSRWEEMRSIRDDKRRVGLDPGDLTNAEMETITNLHQSIAGARRVESFLDELRDAFETTGVVTNEQQEQLREHLGHEADSLLLALSRPSIDEREERDSFVLRVNVTSLKLGLRARVSDLRKEPEVLELIPLDEKADLLMRYYTFYSREADRASAELERLQRMRSSKLILPPARKNDS